MKTRTTKADRIQQVVYFLEGAKQEGIEVTDGMLLEGFKTLKWDTIKAGIKEYERQVASSKA